MTLTLFFYEDILENYLAWFFAYNCYVLGVLDKKFSVRVSVWDAVPDLPTGTTTLPFEYYNIMTIKHPPPSVLGFNGTGLMGACDNINECEVHGDETYERHNCDTNADCTDTTGGFTCACRSGYTGNGVRCGGEKDFSRLNRSRPNQILQYFLSEEYGFLKFWSCC